MRRKKKEDDGSAFYWQKMYQREKSFNERFFGNRKDKQKTPLNDDEKIELACQLNKLWIKEK